MQYIIYFTFLLALLQGCTNKTTESEFPNAGVITYMIDYPKEISDSPTASLLPNQLKLSFKNNMRRYEFKGSYDIFSLDFYSLSENDSSTTVFRFMGNGLIHVGDVGSNFFFFDKKQTPIIELLDNQPKQIAQKSCSKAIVNYPGSKPFNVYYSEDIDLEMPNRNTPFTEIPGVLLEFYVDYNEVRFHFTARDINYNIPEDSVFAVPNIEKVAAESEIGNLILTLIETLM